MLIVRGFFIVHYVKKWWRKVNEKEEKMSNGNEDATARTGSKKVTVRVGGKV